MDMSQTEDQEILQAMAVLNDPSHSDYSKYNNAATSARIDAYWSKKGAGAQFSLDGGLGIAPAEIPVESQGDDGDAPDRAAAEAVLRQEWGAEYDDNLGAVHGWAQQHLTPETAQSLHERYPGLLDDPQVVKLIHSWANK